LLIIGKFFSEDSVMDKESYDYAMDDIARPLLASGQAERVSRVTPFIGKTYAGGASVRVSYSANPSIPDVLNVLAEAQYLDDGFIALDIDGLEGASGKQPVLVVPVVQRTLLAGSYRFLDKESVQTLAKSRNLKSMRTKFAKLP
jgi:hypothetical protein